uniref:Uncharacterized protein n=1 Tax=Eutreptiella gymnastica TaxID=73025 RepID=A0A7S4GF59_9EUGL|mmetsp:Transcript_4676/g.7482  ORF Transcript_4676/g.7482 Transcript_4676/m.7482 type:complete len:118 (+) Transcript_4676:47-400(+)|eukprot:CAMPEP_0174361008 /NCGR_PEP_ID=MMETSP0811_2-20130205/57254_1 /TAXON_ID=73025 ORGANISM="Eutreptiella gymnastica-like, Strain CCMP1594" /NCGR_SAMPLE_ID=MMETSP0811_2 /ASSEMBLY_ACC=CAM_ASM_000667 /LENGTH=117 /DNA_ID=CAMNT_0015497313 /DNA_START=46 /DNA_END=399 /DNA_ORIENTATION=-
MAQIVQHRGNLFELYSWIPPPQFRAKRLPAPPSEAAEAWSPTPVCSSPAGPALPDRQKPYDMRGCLKRPTLNAHLAFHWQEGNGGGDHILRPTNYGLEHSHSNSGCIQHHVILNVGV